jgi:site-specific DNA-methyltransferase (adenine-specific)
VNELAPLTSDQSAFYRDDLVTIYQADSTHLEVLDDASIDLTVTSPPYNLDISYDGYADAVPYEVYLEWVSLWAAALLRVTRTTGRLCVNIPLDSNKGGKRAVYADYVRVLVDAGWRYQTTIVWNEQNISRRTAWGSWLSPSAPFITAPVEMVGVFYKDNWKRPRGDKRTDLERDEFLAWTLGVWHFQGENPRKVGHPAPFPVELPRRLIKLYSYVGDVVLDPFLGSGTTAVAAKVLGRRCVGIDRSADYCAVAAKRCRRTGGTGSEVRSQNLEPREGNGGDSEKGVEDSSETFSGPTSDNRDCPSP